MYPIPLIDELCVRQMVADVGVVAGDKGDICCTAFGVVAVLGSAYGLVQRLAAET